MNVIQVPDISRKLVTRYGLREKSPTPTLAAEVVPVILVDDLVGESDLIKPRIRPCAGTHELNPVAQTVLFGLMNPDDSGVIIHLYYFLLQSSSTVVFDLHFTGTPGTGVDGTKGFRNGLLPAQAPAGLMTGHLTGVNPGGVIEAKLRGSTVSNIFPFDAVLDEKQGIQLRTSGGGVQTSSVILTCIWSEEDKR
jgi:hypothetical protein